VYSASGDSGSHQHTQALNPNQSLSPHGSQVPQTFWLLVAIQGVSLVGAIVAGIVARNRKQELLDLNLKLRQINAELRKRTTGGGDPVCAAGEDEAMASYRLALEKSVSGARAPHPYEAIGDQNLSLAKARQQLTKVIREGRTALLDGDGALAVEKSQHCATLAEDMKDVRAIRAVARLKASALRKVGNLEGALEELRRALSLSEELQDFSLDADIWGEMADTYADLGNYEQAAQAYDKCILAIQEDRTSPQTNTWDC
jgi:tetratricopeptide (TPR) repeat protein